MLLKFSKHSVKSFAYYIIIASITDKNDRYISLDIIILFDGQYILMLI